MSTLLDERPETKTDDGSGSDDPKVAHYARKEEITEAYVMGTEILALCGLIFIPTRDPERLPVCPRCQEIIDKMPWGGDPDA